MVSLDTCSDFLNIDRTDENLILSQMLGAAIERCSNYVGFSLRRANVQYFFENCKYIKIPSNILAVSEVAYQSAKDVWTAMSTDDYYLNKNEHIPCLTIINRPTLYDYEPAYRVSLEEGFYCDEEGSGADFEDKLSFETTQAILLTVAHLYGNRNDVNIVETYSLTQGAEFYLNPIQKLHIL